MSTSRASHPWTQTDTLVAGALVLVALLLLVLAARQLLTQLSRIPANSYYDTHQAHFLAADTGTDYLRDTRARFEQIPPEQRGDKEWRRLAAVALMQPLTDDEPETFAQSEQFITQALSASLVRNPLQPLGWAYLANLQLPPNGDCASGMAALRQSYRVAPVEPDFLTYRLDLAVRCPMQWDSAFLNALRTDLLSLLKHPRYDRRVALGSWAAQRPRVQALIVRLLREYPEESQRFKRFVRQFSKSSDK